MENQEKELSEQEKQNWIDYRNAVSENKSKSQDDFEKYINLLASGGIVLSLTFLEKIITVDKTIFKGFYIVGLSLLVITLLSNLYSHYKSINDSDLIIEEIDQELYDEIFTNIGKRNKIINRLNKASIWSLIIGTLLILTFVSINLFNMNENQTPTPKDITNLPSPDTGRTNPAPIPPPKKDSK